MRELIIELHVKVPHDIDDETTDSALANAIEELGGEVIDSKEFKELTE